MIDAFHRDIAAAIRPVLTEPGRVRASRERIAAFARRTAERLHRDRPAFSIEWFYGACGLDDWGDLFTEADTNRRELPR